MSSVGLYDDGVLTREEAAEFLRVSRRTVDRLMASGKIPYTRIGSHRRIPKRALVKALEDNEGV